MSVDAALALIDEDGTCLYASGATDRLFRTAPLALVGSRISTDASAAAPIGDRPFPAVGIAGDVNVTVRCIHLGAASTVTALLARSPASPAPEEVSQLMEAVRRAVDSFPAPAALVATAGATVNAAFRRMRGSEVNEVPSGTSTAVLPVTAGPGPPHGHVIIDLSGSRAVPVAATNQIDAIRLAALLAPGPCGLIVLDDHGEILHASRALRELLGWKGAEWSRGSLVDLGDDLRTVTSAPDRRGSPAQHGLHWRLQAADGRWISFDVTALNLLDDPAIGGIVARLGRPAAVSSGEMASEERHILGLVESARAAIIRTDLDGVVRYWNAGAEHLFGIRREDILGAVASFLRPPGTPDDTVLAARLLSENELAFVTTYEHPRGALVHVCVRLTALLDGRGRISGVTAIANDITARVEEAASRRHYDEEQARRASQHAIIAALSQLALRIDDLDVFYRDAASAVATTLDLPVVLIHRLIDASAMLVGAYGWEEDVARSSIPMLGAGSGIGSLLSEEGPLVTGDLGGDPRFPVPTAALHMRLQSAAVVVVPGHEQPVGLLTGITGERRLFHPDELNFIQAVANIIGTAIDRVRAADEMRYLALHDPLTGLPNRTLLLDRLSHALALLERRAGLVGLVFVDLDHFKRINDTLGHAVGDELLVEVGQRLRDVVREGDTVARLGGDEFLVLCEELGDTPEAELVAERIRASLTEPIGVGGHQIIVTASVGIAAGDADCTGEDLLRRSDLAMYEAKAAGRGVARTFAPGMDVQVDRRMATEQALRQVLDDDALDVVFQPRVRLIDGFVVGIEAAVVWPGTAPTGGDPAELLGLAEELGLLTSVTAQVLDRACRACVEPQGTHPGLVAAVSLPARQVLHPDVVDLVRAALSNHRLVPRRLVIQIDAAVLNENAEAVQAALQSLRGIGVQVGVGQLGAGWAALRSLGGLAVDELVVDQPLVHDVGDPDAAAVVGSMVSVARAVGIRVIADGVQTSAQVEALRRLRCTVGQGPFWSGPLPATELSQWLAGLDSFHTPVA